MSNQVTHVDGAFIVEKDGKRLAETTYRLEGTTMHMPHTWVDDSLRGQGVAKALVHAAVDYAREHHYKIKPTCPFVKAELAKDVSLQDVLAA